MKFEKTEVFNFYNAIRGMRNPMNSWDKSDSTERNIGRADLDLALRLVKGGTEHRKFMRQIFVSVDIVAPMYWWSQFDTYKIGTTANSTSKMHKLLAKEFEVTDFEVDEPTDGFFDEVIEVLNLNRKSYFVADINNDEQGKKEIWRYILQLLPESYLQKRTVTLNYEVILNMYLQRKHHKLIEWDKFCGWAESLPYFSNFLSVLDI